MRYLIKLITLSLVVVNTNACSVYKISPSISFRNYSEDYIYHLKGHWNGYRLVQLDDNQYPLPPGSSGMESFTLRKKSDLFGPVHIEWQNAKKEKIVKEFIFTKEQMPNFSYEKNGHISFYLTQNDLIMFVRQHGSERGEEELKVLKKIGQFERNHLKKKCEDGYESPYCLEFKKVKK